MVTAVWKIWLELAPWLLLGAFVAGLLHVFVPAGFLQKHLTGRLGVLKAVLVGIPLPLCSCGVIPVGLGLRKDGASNGATVGFLISTPQTGVDSVLVSASFLGWPFAVLKVLVALVTGVVGGLLTGTGQSRVEAPTKTPDADSARHVKGFQAFFRQAMDIIQSIWGWLVVGVLISAAITWLVPENSLANIPLLTGFSALLLTLLISLPLYVCATASVPIAAALVNSGLPAGAALVFLMAGPATNVATLGSVYRTLGGRTLVVYLVTIIGGSIVAGLAFNDLIPADVAHLHGHHHTSSWWRVASAIVLGVIIAKFAFDDVRRWFRKRRAIDSAAVSTMVPVQGMTCDGCAARLEGALEARTDVDRADVSFSAGTATVFGTVSQQQIGETIREAGFVAVDDGSATESCSSA